jgi:hypothetical protein
MVLALGAAPAAQAHVLTQGTAQALAERFNRTDFERSSWAEEWGPECNRETPWTFSCYAEVWSTHRWCWQSFDVVQPNLGVWGRPRLEEIQPWECEAT